MLTAAQCATAAYMTEDGELLCPSCFDRGDTYAKPLSQYSLDEWQSSSESDLDWQYADKIREADEDEDRPTQALIRGIWHAEACCCEDALYDEAGHELVERYVDSSCEEVD